jgi:hypothetical protein
MKSNNSLAVSTAALFFIPFGRTAISDEKPSDIRKQLAAVTAEFYALYNKLNTDRQYDMICKKDPETGTRFEKNVCLPRYARESQHSVAIEYMQAATHAFSIGYGIAMPGEVSSKGSSPKWDGYLDNIRGVLEKSPELQALAEKRDDLRALLVQSNKK